MRAVGRVALAAAALLAAEGAVGTTAKAQGSAAAPQVVITASHHHVLRHWLRAAQEGALPESGVTVVHFDGHPDLAVPEAPLAKRRPLGPALPPGIDISSFQLAAAWMGLADRFIWLRPDWAHQLPDGKRSFHLGRSADGRLRVDDEHDYYVLEESWAPREELQESILVTLEVLPWHAPRPALPPGGILDIDLDGFGTRNPGADSLRAAGLSAEDLALLRSAFSPERLVMPPDPRERILALARLVKAAEGAASDSSLEILRSAFTLWRAGIDLPTLTRLYRLLSGGALQLTPRAVEDVRLLVGLPEAPAEAEATRLLAAHLAQLAQELRPGLITIARSVSDGFTPAQAWPEIEWTLLGELARVLPEAPVLLDPGLQPAPRIQRAPRKPAAPKRDASSRSTGRSPKRP